MIGARSSRACPPTSSTPRRLARRLACHQALHDPAQRTAQPPALAAGAAPLAGRSGWSAASTASWHDPRRAPGGAVLPHRCLRRPRLQPARRRHRPGAARRCSGCCPSSLLATVADGIELGALTHAFDLRMAEALASLAPTRRRLDDELYAQAYRRVGLPRLRSAPDRADRRSRAWAWAHALRMPGSRHAADAVARAGAGGGAGANCRGSSSAASLRSAQLGDVDAFLAEIERSERRDRQSPVRRRCRIRSGD